MPAFRYCPHCRAELVLAQIEGRDRLRCPACAVVFYDNAKPCAGAILHDEEGRVLLTRRAAEPFKGWWDLPGGYCEADEHPADTARREVLEETGLTIELDGLVGLYMDTYGPGGAYTLNVFYAAHAVAGTLAAREDVSEATWVPIDRIPWEEFSFENGKQALRDWLSRSRAGHLAPERL